MSAYCLTVYKGTNIEKFDLEVIDVVYNFQPGRNAILVMGTDPRFLHTGPVAGCSGSPVYIDGRLAGALAFGWSFSKDPLYGVTPITEMLRVGSVGSSTKETGPIDFRLDYSKQIDFADVQKRISQASEKSQINQSSLSPLPFPVITSQLPSGAIQILEQQVKPFGFMAIPGSGSGKNNETDEAVELANGSCLAVPLVTGDIEMTAMGTVTEVVGDKIYGFGHSFLGYGPIDVPMATGKIHTIVSNLASSFKYGRSIKVIGAIRADESTAIYGLVGETARMIPMTIRVKRFNDAQNRVYNCSIANNQQLTPTLLGPAVASAALMAGDLPPDNVIHYKMKIGLENGKTLNSENSSIKGLEEILSEGTGAVTLLMNNPFKKVKITSLDFEVDIVNKKALSGIWSASLSDTEVKAGQNVKVSVITSSVLAEKKEYQFDVKIPEQLKPGKYNILVTGGEGYLEFLRQAMPQKFIANSLPSLIDAINDIFSVNRNQLHCLLTLPADGVVLEKAELPNLPGTKTLVMADSKRTLQMNPYPHWIDNSKQLNNVVMGKKVLEITIKN